jgi:hypothetical protein
MCWERLRPIKIGHGSESGTTTCSKLLRDIKETSSHALTPMSFFNELYGQQTGLGTGRSPRSFPNGNDYGRPRPGYDPFQMFFWLMGSNAAAISTELEKGLRFFLSSRLAPAPVPRKCAFKTKTSRQAAGCAGPGRMLHNQSLPALGC